MITSEILWIIKSISLDFYDNVKIRLNELNHFDFFRLSPQDNLVAFQELTIDNLNIIE